MLVRVKLSICLNTIKNCFKILIFFNSFEFLNRDDAIYHISNTQHETDVLHREFKTNANLNSFV